MEDDATSPAFGAVLTQEQFRLARQTWKWLVVYFAVTTAPSVLLEIRSPNVGWLDLWVSIFSWAAGYLLLIALMDRAGLPMRAGIGTYFAVGIVTTLAIMIGIFALVLPGLYLILRWLPVYVRCLATEDGIGSSLRWSWNVTEPFQKELGIALLGPMGLVFAAYGAVIAYDYFIFATDLGYFASVVMLNLAISVAYAWLTVLGVAAYLAIEQAEPARAAAAGG